MRILITNDDGINAPGLVTLASIAKEIAGPEGEVWTVAPAFEQSGVGHCISYTHPTMIAELGPRRFAAEGSPADCVLAGVHHVLKDARPDLVLSGVNRGNNSAESAMYSGTLGGAMEAALQDIPAIAMSQFFGPGNRDLADPFEAALLLGPALVQQLLEAAPWGGQEYKTFYNVNFPPFPAAEVKGAVAVRQGWRPTARHRVEAQASPSGRQFLWVRGGPPTELTGPGTDVNANVDGFISVTPMRADLTAHDLLGPLEAALS